MTAIIEGTERDYCKFILSYGACSCVKELPWPGLAYPGIAGAVGCVIYMINCNLVVYTLEDSEDAGRGPLLADVTWNNDRITGECGQRWD